MSDEQLIPNEFDHDLIRKYPKANRRLNLSIEAYGLTEGDDLLNNGQSQFISPHGLEFKTSEDLSEGSLVKIHVSIPNYWTRKQRFVDYTRIDTPGTFKILAKVVKSEEVGKRGKKRMVICQTLVIDEVDKEVLENYLQEG